MKKIDWNKPIKFVNHDYPVRFSGFVKSDGTTNRVIVVYSTGNNAESVLIYDIGGQKHPGADLASDWDIINIPTVKKFYMNIYRGPHGFYPGKLFENENDVRRAASANNKDVVKTIAVELEV